MKEKLPVNLLEETTKGFEEGIKHKVYGEITLAQGMLAGVKRIGSPEIRLSGYNCRGH